MTIDLTLDDEQQLLAESVRAFVQRDCPPDRVRAGDGRHDAGLWQTIAAAGWTGIALPEATGGFGRGLLHLAVVCEELGRGAVSSPLVASAAGAALPIAWAGTDDQRRRWLPALASGERVGTLAHLEPGMQHASDPVGLSGAVPLRGTKVLVPWAPVADLLVVTTKDGVRVIDGAAGDVVRVTTHAGLGVEPLGTVELGDAPAEPLGDRDASGVVGRALDHAAVASLAYAVGVMESMLASSVQHARDRHQFGRPIGSFQAVAHRCVDMRTDIDACRYLAYQAAWALDRGESAEVEVGAALSYGLDAARRVAMHAHQVHGAIGFSTEHDLHLSTRRAKAFELTYGPASWYRERLAGAMGLHTSL
ncbi:MAG TPA: acyl-CoA dehydrogenase family protein [Acidimicrobiia bacterium]